MRGWVWGERGHIASSSGPPPVCTSSSSNLLKQPLAWHCGNTLVRSLSHLFSWHEPANWDQGNEGKRPSCKLIEKARSHYFCLGSWVIQSSRVSLQWAHRKAEQCCVPNHVDAEFFARGVHSRWHKFSLPFSRLSFLSNLRAGGHWHRSSPPTLSGAFYSRIKERKDLFLSRYPCPPLLLPLQWLPAAQPHRIPNCWNLWFLDFTIVL